MSLKNLTDAMTYHITLNTIKEKTINIVLFIVFKVVFLFNDVVPFDVVTHLYN